MEMERKKNKTVADSLTEVTKLLQYKDINGYDRLFGGRLMEWIDEAAGFPSALKASDTDPSFMNASLEEIFYSASGAS